MEISLDRFFFNLPGIGGGISSDCSFSDNDVDFLVFLPMVRLTFSPAFRKMSTQEPCVTALQSIPFIFSIASP